MSFNALAIMFRPMLANYLQPLEENGTIAKLQADISLVAQEGAIPALVDLVSQLKEHNALLREIADRMKADANRCAELAAEREYPAFPDSIAGTTGPIAHIGV